MKKKSTLFPHLLLVLFLVISGLQVQAQEKIWSIQRYQSQIVSENKDGSDVNSFQRLDTAFESHDRITDPVKILTLPDNSILIFENYGGESDAGGLIHITPQGLKKIYDNPEYAPYYEMSMILGKDGYLYAFRHDLMSGSFLYINKIKSDGTEITQGARFPVQLHDDSRLTYTDQGLYGASPGLGSEIGFVFRMKDDLSNYVPIYHFNGSAKRPNGKLIEGRDGYLYGTTRIGGQYNYGTLFKISKDGTSFVNLYDFNNINAKNPSGGLVQDSDGFLYGYTSNGSKKGKGIIFKIGEDGQSFQKLLDIADVGGGSMFNDLILDSEGYLYGGVADANAFKLKTDGTQFKKLSSQSIPQTFAKPSFAPDVFVTSPVSGSTNVSSNLILQIKPFEGERNYQVELSESPAFTGTTIVIHSPEPQVSVKSLKTSTTYYTRVKPSVWPYYGATTSFKTSADSIGNSNISITSPVHYADNVTTHTPIYVTAVSGANTYQVQLCESSNFTTAIQTLNSSDTIVYGANLKYGTTYYVRAKTNLSDVYGSVSLFTTRTSVADAYIISPTANAINVQANNVKIIVNAVDSATQYSVWINTSPYFFSGYGILQSGSTPGQRAFNFTAASNATYYVRAKTNLSSEWGPVTTFTTASNTTAFVSNPANGSVNNAINNLKATANIIAGAKRYTIELNTSAGFDGTSFVRTSAIDNQRTLIFNGLEYNTTYYTRMKTDNADNWGSTRSFTTMANPTIALARVAAPVAIDIYPNPTSNNFTIRFDQALDEKTSLVLTDVKGNVVYKQDGDTFNTFQFGDDLNLGIYILKVIKGNTTSTYRLSKN